MIKRNLPPFQAVPLNGDAIIPVLPQGMTYAAILLTLGGGLTKAQISALYLTLGGKEIWNGISATDLNAINSYYKLSTDTTHLLIPFCDDNAEDWESYGVGGIDTSPGYSDFSLKAVIAGAAGTPTLSAMAYLKMPQPRDKKWSRMFRAIRKTTPATPSANTHDLKVALGGRSEAYIRALHLKHANGTHFEVKKDAFGLCDKNALADIQFLQAQKNRAVQAGYFSWDPMIQNDAREAVPTLKQLGGKTTPADFEFKLTTSADDNVTAFTDMLTTLDNI